MRREELGKEREARDASGLTVGVVVSTFNTDITESLLDGALEALAEWGVKDENVQILRVAGAFELPQGCAKLASRMKPDALVALGCIIKGETEHDRHLAAAAFQGLMDLAVARELPLGLGVLTTADLSQAQARATGEHNAGRGAAFAAMELALS